MIQGRRWRPPVSPRENPGRLAPAGNAAPAALPARLSGQKVVYGCMQGTGVIFRDTVTVSGCLLLRPLRLPAAGGIRSSGPTPTGSCWRTRQSPPNPLARFRAAATVRCVKTRLAATVPVAPPLSRRDLRSLHT
ncbi:hypothetical protein IVW58_02295 [Salmonella enterica subsp. enterica serovar Worthington]|nr:hypothetical protein [Salmonella enterica subsp. enterica serovar Worthington]